MNCKILIIDDEAKMGLILRRVLVSEGYIVDCVDKPFEGISLLEKNHYDIILCDLKMPDMSGLEVLEKSKKIQPGIDFIMMTAYSTVQTAVEAMKKGAFDYLIKPFSMDELKILIKRIIETTELKEENQNLKEVINETFHFNNIIAQSKSMESVLSRVKKVAKSSACVLIRGESGTGKEIIAKCIHFSSQRSDKPLITVNCGAIPETLLESELFGYTKGAFTGATETRKGLFECADKGTVFLDEIGEIPQSLQVKLLRVLQDGEFQRVGNYSEKIKVDVRVIAATNRNLEEAVKNNKFREDLYFRLNVVPINIPPLRDRKEDIDLLVKHFINKYSEPNSNIKINQSAMKLILEYNYPGNIRELENAIQHAIVMSNDNIINEYDLPASFIIFNNSNNISSNYVSLSDITIDNMEIQLILNSMKKTKCNHTKAASLLGITRRTLGYRIKKYKLEEEIDKLRLEREKKDEYYK